MSHRTLMGGAMVLAGIIVACESNPPLAPDSHDEGLTVVFSYTPDHVHILQSEVTFTVQVLDHHGEAVTDFEILQVERLQEGSDTWRGIDLALNGDVYEGTYVFASSGEYHLRVSGQRHGETELQVLHELPETMHCARAHAEAGGYRIEFETFPGHIHEGDAAAMRFWVMEIDRDPVTEVRPPVPGLSLDVHVAQTGGYDGLYPGSEIEPGVYEATHTFEAPEDTHAGLHFIGSDAQPAEAEFELHIAHKH